MQHIYSQAHIMKSDIRVYKIIHLYKSFCRRLRYITMFMKTYSGRRNSPPVTLPGFDIAIFTLNAEYGIKKYKRVDGKKWKEQATEENARIRKNRPNWISLRVLMQRILPTKTRMYPDAYIQKCLYTAARSLHITVQFVCM